MKVFVIGVRKHELSWQSATIACESARRHGYDAEIFSAFTGHNGRVYLAKQGLSLRAGMKPHSLGTTGCFASHHRLWALCAASSEPIIVAEHDATFLRAWPEPDWQDVLHLNWEGSSLRRARRFDLLGDRYAAPRLHCVYRHGFEPYDWPGLVAMSCAYAYALKPHAARALLHDCRESGWFYTDRLMREPIVSIETIHPAVAVEQEIALSLSLTKGRGAD